MNLLTVKSNFFFLSFLSFCFVRYISDWIYQKKPPNAGINYYYLVHSDAEKGLLLAAMIPARIKLKPSLNNATCRLHSCLTADYNYLTRLCHRTTDYD